MFRVVDGFIFDVKVGEVFGFLGLNGVGKIIMIFSMFGIIIFDDGRIEILGMDMLRELIKIKECIGYFFENVIIYGEFIVWKNLEFFVNFYRMSNFEREKWIIEFFKRVGFWDVCYWKVKMFLKGMK